MKKYKVFRRWFYLKFELFANIKCFGFLGMKTLNIHQGILNYLMKQKKKMSKF